MVGANTRDNIVYIAIKKSKFQPMSAGYIHNTEVFVLVLNPCNDCYS